MADNQYFAKYVRFTATEENKGMEFLGPDNLIGDKYEIDFVTENEETVAWVRNRFNRRIAYFDEDTTYELRLCVARGWTVHAFLSFVAYTEVRDADEPSGYYWGEMAIIAYAPTLQECMENFEKNLRTHMSNSARPNLKFGSEGLRKIQESNGEWFPTDRVKLPKLDKNSAFVRDSRSINDNLVESAREGKKGCYVASFAIYALLAALILFGLHSCGVF